MGTLHIANAMRRLTPKARLIWSGSSEAYGNAFNRSTSPVSEGAALEPMSPYGATKAAADIMLRQMAEDGFEAIAFGRSTIPGPGRHGLRGSGFAAERDARIEAGLQEPILNVGNLEARRDFLDVQDVAEAYLLAATGPLPPVDATMSRPDSP